MVWLSSVVLFAGALMVLAGLALMLDAGARFVRMVRAGERSHRG